MAGLLGLSGGLLLGQAAAGGGGDPHFANVVLLAHFDGADGGFAGDSSNSNHSLTYFGGAALDTAQKKFGTASALFDGTDDFIRLDDSADWDFGSGQFTVEAWVRWNSISAGNGQQIVCQWASGELAWTLRLPDSDVSEVAFAMSVDGSTLTGGANVLTSGANITTGQWYHIAADRDAAGKIRVYVDGAMLGSATGGGTIFNSSTQLGIGAEVAGITNFRKVNGWIDDLRITKGVARYASDAGFTVPAAAFPDS